jgi:DNA-binding MurR/RpiR family transcriptional regulator
MDTRTTTSDLVAAAGDRLTPTDRRIAEAVLAEPTLLAFGTVSDLATRVGTSRPSIVRFAHKLGFTGYADLQRYVRSGLSEQITRPSQRIRHDGGTDLTARTTLIRAIDSVFEALDDGRLETLAAPLVSARSVWIVSGETSRAGAHTLYSGLSIIRPQVHLLDGSSVAVDLNNAESGDAAVAFDFSRYRAHAVHTLEILADLGVDIVAVTDGPLSPLATLATTWCQIDVPAIGPFDSSVPAVAVAELLVAHVAGELHDAATMRIDRIEELWNATDTFFQSE